jgi:hypothetical protein
MDKVLWAAFRRGRPGERRSACPGASDFAAYLEGTAPRALEQEIETHLLSCAECLNALGDLRSMLGEPLRNAPADARERAKALVALGAVREPLPWLEIIRFSFRSAAGWAAAAALIVAACAAGYVMGQGSTAEAWQGSASAYLAPAFGADGSGESGDVRVGGPFLRGGAL